MIEVYYTTEFFEETLVYKKDDKVQWSDYKNSGYGYWDYDVEVLSERFIKIFEIEG